MSASILYHCFGLVKINYLKTEFKKGRVIFFVELKDKVCSRCKSFRVIQHSSKHRYLKTVPISWKSVMINLRIRRLQCRDCHHLGLESYDQIAESRKHYTRKLSAYIIALSHRMTIQDLTAHLHMHWNTL